MRGKGKLQRIQEKIIVLYFNNSKNMSEVARILGCSVPGIQRILKEDNINTSSKGKKFTRRHRENIKKNHWSRNKEIRDLIISKSNTPQKSEKIKKMKIGKKRPDLSIINKKKRGRKQTKKFMEFRKKQILPKKDTSIEKKIQGFLKQLGIEFFTHQYIKEIEHSYQCDILIPSMNMVIECDGDYWHKYPIGLEKDRIRTKELIEKGFRVLRLWECEIKELDLSKFKRRLGYAWKT